MAVRSVSSSKLCYCVSRIDGENAMKDDKDRTDRHLDGKAAQRFGVVLGVGLTVVSVWSPSEGGAFCRPTDFCAPLPISLGDEPAPARAPQLTGVRAVAGSSVSVSGLLAGSSVSYRT